MIQNPQMAKNNGNNLPMVRWTYMEYMEYMEKKTNGPLAKTGKFSRSPPQRNPSDGRLQAAIAETNMGGSTTWHTTNSGGIDQLVGVPMHKSF